MDDLTHCYGDWSDEKLDEHRRAILREQERRVRLDSLPEQIATLRREYLDAGGDPDDLAKLDTEEGA